MSYKLTRKRLEAMIDDEVQESQASEKIDKKKAELMRVNDAIAKRREDEAVLVNRKRLSGDWLSACGSLW